MSDLWVEGAFPSQSSSDTLESLQKAGIIPRQLVDSLVRNRVFQSDLRLHSHQAESVRLGHAARTNETKPAIVVTAGTGAGKTESFLLPMLSELFETTPVPGEGVDCLIVYPMNALVNDQMDRLYSWLKGQDKVTVFHFTGETPEDHAAAEKAGVSEWDICRFRSRQEARGLADRNGKPTQSGRTPRIVVTNISMLEYMLCRPQDAVFFGRNLRTIVVDEAHLYSGNLAAEVAILLRRISERCAKTASEITHFATSATIGASTDLPQFAARFFSKPLESIQLIQGKTQPLSFLVPGQTVDPSIADRISESSWLETNTLDLDGEGARFSTLSEAEWGQWQEALSSFIPRVRLKELFAEFSCKCEIAPLLYHALLESPLAAFVYGMLWQTKRIPLQELAQRAFGAKTDAALNAMRILLQLLASARDTPGGYPLVPNRIHAVVRSPEGLTFCLNLTPEASLARTYTDKGYVLSNGSDVALQGMPGASLSMVRDRETATCYLLGVLEGGFIKPLPLLQSSGTSIDMDDPDDAGIPISQMSVFSLKEVPGSTPVLIDPVTGEYGVSKGTQLWRVPAQLLDEANMQFFGSHGALHLSILAETMLNEMPSYPGARSQWLPAGGRRLLVFSDGRNQAAKLGPRLTRQHERFVLRAGLLAEIEKNASGGPSGVRWVEKKLSEAQEELLELGEGNSEVRVLLENQIQKYTADLARIRAGGSIEDWCSGLLKQPLVRELFDEDGADGHTESWSQRDWETNGGRVKSKVERLVAGEFAYRYTWPNRSLETLGLIEVVYPGLEALEPDPVFVGSLSSETARIAVRALWSDYLASMCDHIRSQACVTLGSEEEDASGIIRSGLGHWSVLRLSSSVFTLKPLIGRGAQENFFERFTSRVLQAAGVPVDDLEITTERIIESAFRTLLAAHPHLEWLEVSERSADQSTVPGLRLVFKKLALRVPRTVFQCAQTGQVWPRSVLGCYPRPGQGLLVSSSQKELDQSERLKRAREELRSSPVFQAGLWAEEHSAQLNPKENRRLQNLFRLGVRNILSCTTTLELGIDIGGLNGVLMANMPPGKANYLQRAGRAGRRSDGSSVVVTYARALHFEREAFLNFGEYLARPFRRPTVTLDRMKIVRRQVHSFLLGEFFRGAGNQPSVTGAMNAFGNMGLFCGAEILPFPPKDGSPQSPFPVAWKAASAEAFIRFVEDPSNQRLWTPRLERLLRETALNLSEDPREQELGVSEIVAYAVEELKKTIADWRRDYSNLVSDWNQALDSQNISVMTACVYQAKEYRENTVIAALGDYQFLPRYGFPIGLNKLRVPEVKRRSGKASQIVESEHFRLERASVLAIQEYVPGSRRMVGSQIVTSMGILKHWTGQNAPDASFGLRGNFVKLDTGEFRYSTSELPALAPSERELKHGEILFAKHGFTTAPWEPPVRYGDTKSIGQVELFVELPPQGLRDKHESTESFAEVQGLRATYTDNADLIAINGGEQSKGFAVCTKCGYSESEVAPGQNHVGLSQSFLRHSSLYHSEKKKSCWKKGETGLVLRHQYMAGRQNTDVVFLDLAGWGNGMSQAAAYTVAQALRLAGCQMLELDCRELSILPPAPMPSAGMQGRALVLLDSVAGGAGHCLELFRNARPWLAAARDLLAPSEHILIGSDADVRLRTRKLLTPDCPRHLQLDPLAAFDLISRWLEGDPSHSPVTGTVVPPKAGAPSAASDAQALIAAQRAKIAARAMRQK